jgi:hypothetical protein
MEQRAAVEFESPHLHHKSLVAGQALVVCAGSRSAGEPVTRPAAHLLRHPDPDLVLHRRRRDLDLVVDQQQRASVVVVAAGAGGCCSSGHC